MKIEEIKKIIGPSSYERLKKEKITTAQHIKKTPLKRLMSIAGIGPQKTKELYKGLGLKIDNKLIEKTYRDLNDRTKFKNIRKAVDWIKRDPKDDINKLENVREQAYAWHNLFASLKNVSLKARGEKPYELKVYRPVGTNLIDPYALTEEQKISRDNIYAEVQVTPEIAEKGVALPNSGININFKTISLDDHRVLSDETAYVGNKNSVAMATEIKNIINEYYDRYRKKTLLGHIVVVIDSYFEELFFTLQDFFEAQNKTISLVLGKEMYKSFAAIWKYEGNKKFEEMVIKINTIIELTEYQEFLNRGGKDKYEAWFKENEDDIKEQFFWQQILEYKKSYYRLKGLNLLFGYLEAMPDITKERTDIQIKTGTYVIEEYEDLKEILKEPPEKIEYSTTIGFERKIATIPKYAIAIADEALRNYTTQINGSKIIFKSTELPEIGLVYEGG